MKWNNGYRCGKCDCREYYLVKKAGSRLCTNCKYAESATARTLFHKVKFPLRKAFYIVYMMACPKKGISSYELSGQLSLRQKTCRAFQRKILQAMKSEGNNLLNGTIEVDEFFIGGPEEGETGRGNDKKQQVVMAIQTDGFGIHHCYAKVIGSADSDEPDGFFIEHIARESNVKTDSWKGYKPLKKDYTIEQLPSKKGTNFLLFHRQVMMFKSWLRGIHHHCKHLQRYLDEFCYRFNRIKYPETLFHKLVERMVFQQPLFYQKYQCA